jgi:hypothetical protein
MDMALHRHQNRGFARKTIRIRAVEIYVISTDLSRVLLVTRAAHDGQTSPDINGGHSVSRGCIFFVNVVLIKIVGTVLPEGARISAEEKILHGDKLGSAETRTYRIAKYAGSGVRGIDERVRDNAQLLTDSRSMKRRDQIDKISSIARSGAILNQRIDLGSLRSAVSVFVISSYLQR